MENQTSSIESLWDKVRDYIETRIELLKLKSIDKASGILATIITWLLVMGLLFFFFIMANIGLSLWLGHLLGQPYYGFFIVAGLYAITGIILLLGRKRWIKRTITNKMIKTLMD